MSRRRYKLVNSTTGISGAESNDLTSAVTWANVPDANITQSSVTQHEAALTILESQITDGSILARLAAAETVTGNWVFDNNLTVGNQFYIYDGTDTDYALFSHDGTDFNTTFATTTDWNISGITDIELDGVNLRIRSGSEFYMNTDDNLTTSLRIDPATGSGNVQTWTPTGDIRVAGGNNFDIRAGGTLRVLDSGDTDALTFSHDGTDASIGAVTTTDLNITNDFAGVDVDANLEIRNGHYFRVYDSGDDDFLDVSVTAGQATISVQGTGSPAALTIDEATDFNGQTVQQFIAGDFDYESASETVSANAVTLTYSEGPAFEVDLEAATGTVTITISGGPSSGNYGCITVKVQQDSTADRTITWAGGTFVWADGSAHTQNTGSDAISIYTFESWDGGTTWYATGADYE